MKGNNNTFAVDKNYRTFRTNVILHGEGQRITVGKGAHFGNVGLNAQENTSIEIGDDALFSYQTEIRTTDAHSVLDYTTKERLNPAKSIKIGNHVWIGMQTIISKGVVLADDIIVGAKAMVVKSVNQSHVMIAGVPAKIMKENVTWSLDRK
jgi:acetyltransferase-like isoleucine patch superfamily enzyme